MVACNAAILFDADELTDSSSRPVAGQHVKVSQGRLWISEGQFASLKRFMDPWVPNIFVDVVVSVVCKMFVLLSEPYQTFAVHLGALHTNGATIPSAVVKAIVF